MKNKIMFYDNQKYQNQFYNLVDNIEKLDKKLKIYPVDFQKPWWIIIWKQKLLALFAFSSQVLGSSFDALFPLLIAWTIESKSVLGFLFVVGIRFVIIWVYNIMLRYNTFFQIQIMASVQYAAAKYFLTVDPIYHATKSSGQIISKVNRGVRNYEDLLDVTLFDFLEIAVNLVTVIFVMFTFGWKLGLTSLFFIFIIAGFNVIFQIFRSKTFEPRSIKTEDKMTAINVESLQQASFIRTNFATIEQVKKTKTTMFKDMVTLGNSWQAGIYVNVVTRTLQALSVMIIGLLVFQDLDSGEINTVIGLAILTTYAVGTQKVVHIGSQVKRFTRSLVAITDLFSFIRNFGKQTFPVLGNEKIITKN